MVEITPEPSPTERAAILAALEQVLGASRQEQGAVPVWAVAGRREALRGRNRGSRAGWGRGLDRLADS